MARSACTVLVLVLLAGAPRAARAQNPPAYALGWSAVSSGGGTTTGGPWALIGAAASAVAGKASGGPYVVSGGVLQWLPTGNVDVSPPAGPPARFMVEGARPNPFVGGTSFVVDLPVSRSVRMRMYDVGGHLVRSLVDGVFPAGRLDFHWDGTSDDGRTVPAGIYFGHVTAGSSSATVRVVALSPGGVK